MCWPLVLSALLYIDMPVLPRMTQHWCNLDVAVDVHLYGNAYEYMRGLYDDVHVNAKLDVYVDLDVGFAPFDSKETCL